MAKLRTELALMGYSVVRTEWLEHLLTKIIEGKDETN